MPIQRFLTFATSALGNAVKKIGEYEPPTNTKTYQANHYNLVLFKPAFALVDSLFIKRPPLSNFPVESLAVEGYTKLLP